MINHGPLTDSVLKMSVTGDPAGYELAYKAGLNAVDEQASTLRETRDRAGSLLSAATVAAGLGIGLVFTSDNVETIGELGAFGTLLAVVGFIGVVATTMAVWWPAEGRFVQNSGVIVAHFVEGEHSGSLAETHRDLALWLGIHAVANRNMLEKRLKVFSWGISTMVLEILGLILALGDAAYG